MKQRAINKRENIHENIVSPNFIVVIFFNFTFITL